MNQPYGSVDPETAAERAHVLLESEIQARLDAVRDLAKRLNDLDAAIADYLSAWQTATRVGWAENTLTDIGLRSPESVPSPSGRRAADTSAAASAASGTAAAGSTLAPVVALTPAAPTPTSPSEFGAAPALTPVPSFAAPASASVISTPAR